MAKKTRTKITIESTLVIIIYEARKTDFECVIFFGVAILGISYARHERKK